MSRYYYNVAREKKFSRLRDDGDGGEWLRVGGLIIYEILLLLLLLLLLHAATKIEWVKRVKKKNRNIKNHCLAFHECTGSALTYIITYNTYYAQN